MKKALPCAVIFATCFAFSCKTEQLTECTTILDCKKGEVCVDGFCVEKTEREGEDKEEENGESPDLSDSSEGDKDNEFNDEDTKNDSESENDMDSPDEEIDDDYEQGNDEEEFDDDSEFTVDEEGDDWEDIDDMEVNDENDCLAISNEGPVFYVSKNGGDDCFDGKTVDTPWKTFANINGRVLNPGDTIFLKAGESWDEELELSGNGLEGSPIKITGYGDGDNPLFVGTDMQDHRSLTFHNPSYLEISNIDFEGGKIGIYLRYENSKDNKSVLIENCNFKNIADPGYYNDLGAELLRNNYEYAWSAGIMLGGKVHHDFTYENILDGLTLRHLNFNNTDVGFMTNFYHPPVYKSRITNLQMNDIYGTYCAGGVFALNFVDGGIVERVRSLYSGGNLPNGTTGGFTQSSKNVTIDDCEFAYTIRDNCPDGIGFDFEGDNDNFIFSNNVVHNNDGSALLVMSTIGHNNNITVKNNTFYANAKNPLKSDYNREMMCHDSGNNGLIDNNGFYRKNATATYTTKWDGFTKIGNREGLLDTLFPNKSFQWEFNVDGDFEGWRDPSQITAFSVSGGFLSGFSTGDDPFFYSPTIFINSFEYPVLKIRMRTGAGSHAQIFYITDTDRVWNGEKSVFFPLIDNANFHEYSIDLREAGLKGVLIGLRIDPAIVENAQFQIDWIRFSQH